MKQISTLILLVLVGLFCFSNASMADGKKVGTILDKVLQIPKAAKAPVIDGELDGIWKNVTGYQMTLGEGNAALLNKYDDHAATFRAMWDANNFYLFVQVVDDSSFGGAQANVASPWMNDCVELFFDGKNEKAKAYDANDVQWRWVRDETVATHPATGTSPGTWAWKNTASGYNLELKIAKADLEKYFPLVADTEIGFEVSNGDIETAKSPQEVLHWWTSVATTWNDPSLFGTAVLSKTVVSDVYSIAYAAKKPVIDGTKTKGEGWESANEISLNSTEGAATIYPPANTYLNWKDHVAYANFMWDENYFYTFLEVVDDSSFGGAQANVSSPWMNDCVEIFFDGKNEKAKAYDANDIQWRWVRDETVATHPATGTSPGEWIWKNTTLGYNFEMRIAKADLAKQFDLVGDTEIGFEVSNGDLETSKSPQQVLHWWTNVATTWNDPSLFGTAVLAKKIGTAIENNNILPTEYKLEQNYPNPFNPSTKISFAVPTTGQVRLNVYNVIGEVVAELVNETMNAGSYTVDFNARNLSSCVYFYKLNTDKASIVKKMLLIK